MAHHGHTDSIDECGNKTYFAVLSSTADELPALEASVSVQLHAGSTLICISLTPAAASDLAARLAIAAVSATTPEPQLIEFELPKAA